MLVRTGFLHRHDVSARIDSRGCDVRALRVGSSSHVRDRGVRDHIRSDVQTCLLYTSPSPRDLSTSRMPSSA